MSRIHQIKACCRYLIRGKSQYYIHSPFVHLLVQYVLLDKRMFYAYDEAAFIRHQMRKSNRVIEIKDLGAGSHKTGDSKRKLKDMVNWAAIPPKFGQLLFRLVQHFKPAHLLELGTSLGVSSIYQARGNRNGQLFSIEGCPATAQVAAENFQRLGIGNVHQVVGSFEDKLEPVLKRMGRLDWAFIDGNHKEKPTIEYFETCLKYAHVDTIMIFDDIHWSPEMENAWAHIKEHPGVSLTIDLYRLGIVFLTERPAKEHFVLYY